MTTVLFEIEGKATPIDDCSWLMYTPCGCLSGISTVRDGVMSVGEAWRSFEPNAEQRRRDQNSGFRIEAGLRSAAKDLAVECPHDPKWGIEKTPVPDGHQWARVYSAISKGGRKHLVPDIGIENAKEHRFATGDTLALCGATGWHWKTDWWAIDSVPECLRCTGAAKA